MIDFYILAGWNFMRHIKNGMYLKTAQIYSFHWFCMLSFKMHRLNQNEKVPAWLSYAHTTNLFPSVSSRVSSSRLHLHYTRFLLIVQRKKSFWIKDTRIWQGPLGSMKRIHCTEWSGSLLKQDMEKQYRLELVQVHPSRNKYSRLE